MDTPSVPPPLGSTPSSLVSELLVFLGMLIVMFIGGAMLCPLVLREIAFQGDKGNSFGQVMMTGFFLGIPMAWMLCCLALRGKEAYLGSLAFYAGLSYVYGFTLCACHGVSLLYLTDAYLLMFVFPMFHHLFLVPFMLLFNIWLSRGKLPVSDYKARRFGRHALLMLAALWGFAVVTTLIQRL